MLDTIIIHAITKRHGLLLDPRAEPVTVLLKVNGSWADGKHQAGEGAG
jgi:hypothetical protein